jgi:hypothetical protein
VRSAQSVFAAAEEIEEVQVAQDLKLLANLAAGASSIFLGWRLGIEDFKH